MKARRVRPEHMSVKSNEKARRVRPEHMSVKMDSYSSVINAWAQKSEVKQAEQWLEWMCKADMKPELISDNSVINAWAHVSDIRRS